MDEEQNLACNSHASHPSHITLSLLAYNCRRRAIVDNDAVVHCYELCYYFLKHVHAYVTSVNRIYWDSEPTDAWTSPVLDLSRKCQYFRRRLFYFSPDFGLVEHSTCSPLEMELFDEAGLTMCKPNVNQNELMTTLLKKIESLAQDHSNVKRITERNFNKVVEFTETSDRNRAKETRDLAKTMGMNHDTETDQPQISTHLETDADNITDDETDGPNTSQRQPINHVTTRRGNYGGEEQRLPAGKAIRAIETLRGQEDVGVEDFILSVRKASARDFLLDLILTEKITDNAKKKYKTSKN
jgi:hypothetical protein